MRFRTLAICVVACLCGTTVFAQYPYGSSPGIGARSPLSQTNRPTFSPYLNLLRRGNSTLGNYYGLVRPELEFRDANAQFQSNFGALDRRFSESERALSGRQMQTTGHRVQFLSNLRGQVGAPLSRGPRIGRDGRPLTGFSPTGHTSVFGNNGTWYLGLRQRAQQQ